MNLHKYFIEYLDHFDLEEEILSDESKSYNKFQINRFLKKWSDIEFKEKLVVGILIKRDIDFILIYCICLTLGITVVPLNKLWGVEYLNFIINEANINCLILNKNNYDSFQTNTKYNTYFLENLLNNDDFFKEPDFYNKDNSISYVVFTSGTTGLPKGVQISKKSYFEYFNRFPKDKFYKRKGYHLITGEINFDIILADIVIAIKNYRKIFIQDNKNIFSLSQILIRKNIISAYFVPTYLNSVLFLIEGRFSKKDIQDKSLIIYSGGELLSQQICKKIKDNFKNAIIYNNYGPTEVTINCLHCLISDEMIKSGKIPTGLPLENLIYCFDKKYNTCKLGRKGELLVGGDQVMISYTNDVSKNEKLIEAENGDLFYKTGDIFEYGTDGYFYYMGRVDSEVKILGNRLNLEGLRTFCLENLNLEDIVFVDKNGVIICYVKGIKCSKDEIKNTLLKSFPKYVIPKKIIELSTFPLNRNGKLDYNSLRKI